MEFHFVQKILQFAFLCSGACSANIFEIFSNLEELTTPKDSFSTVRELAITNEDTKQASNDSSKKELRSEVSAFTELKPMEAFIAKTSNGRESVLNSLFELNVELKETKEAKGGEEREEGEERKEGEEEKEAYFLDEKDGKSISSLIKNLPILPLVKNEVSIANELVNNNGSLTQYIDSLRENVWAHFKAIVHQYVNTIAPTENNGKDSILTNLLFKSLDLGDNINIIHLLGKKVDPKVYDFMESKLQPLTKALQASPLSSVFLWKNSTLFPSVNDLVNDVAWMVIQHIIQNLLTRIDSKDELLSYVDDLSKINPFAAKGLLFALNLPTKRPKAPPGMEKGRTARTYLNDGYRDSYYRSKSGRYRDDIGVARDGHGYNDDGNDHHDGYGYQEVDYGYGYEMSKDYYLDPYLILAGIGAAALLAYIAFRILTTTMAGRIKRDLDQMDIDTASAIYNHIENGKLKYENDFSSEAENFVDGVNELWYRKASDSCMKCWLGKKLEAHNIPSIKILFLSVVSSIFGTHKTGQFLDHTAQNILNGKPFSCIDDIQYSQ